MRRRIVDTRTWNPKRPPGRALDPEAPPTGHPPTLRATPTEQALSHQMDRRERGERRRYRADEWDAT